MLNYPRQHACSQITDYHHHLFLLGNEKMFDLKINEEDVNAYIAKAILDASIGKKLTETVNKAIQEALEGYNSPVKKLAIEEVQKAIKSILEQSEWQEKMKLHVAKYVTEDWITKIVERSVDQVRREIRERD